MRYDIYIYIYVVRQLRVNLFITICINYVFFCYVMSFVSYLMRKTSESTVHAH